MKLIKKHKKKVIAFMSVGVIIFSIGGARAALSEPGSQSDPLVTLSYVEKRVEEVKVYINDKVNSLLERVDSNSSAINELKTSDESLSSEIDNLKNKIADSNNLESNLEVVELRDGQSLICNAGTEIILRGGGAKAIVSDLGGLSDVTGGRDIKGDEDIPANHLLIIPRNDGRGVYVSKYAIFMVRGNYEIK